MLFNSLDIANKKNFKLYGSFNPSKYNLESNDFYDGMHCKEKVIKKIFLN